MSLAEPTLRDLIISHQDSLNRLRLAAPRWIASERKRGTQSMAFLTAEIEKLKKLEGKKR
ncbi:MAG TPA: hypothetical protein VNV36_06070 [Pseudomonas sp.]|uniref:hypothetical protein n=1 Tax=Pseudomonas sp. TaxID=306 RepID=UPI002CDDB23D|nr:hypothetical protein [Pseudomonas sp.]HWH86324.1 hypothetical protein [Pseudomonas sp.]